MLTYPKPKAVLFDWDNTLVDSWPIIHEALYATFIAMGQTPWTMEQTQANTHFSLRDAFPELFGDRWEEARQVYFETFLRVHLEKLALMPGVEETLKMLRGSGVFMGVVSNKTGAYLREEVEHLGWQRYFDVVIGATDAPEDKPSAAPLHLALEDAEFKAGPEVWMIGDAMTDLECAFNSGSTPVFFGAPDVPKAYRDSHPHRAELLKSLRYAMDHDELRALLTFS